MGCDIHFYVERHVDGAWQSADTWEKSKYADEDSDALSVDYEKAFYNDRNYNLFSILADVRNGRGFAGVKTGEGFNPIAPPRGVPEDACPEYRALQEAYGCDGHSHSYVTLAELLSYDWTQESQLQGWVNPAEWAVARDRNDGPRSWSGDISGPMVQKLTAEEFEAAWQTLREERGYPEQRYASHHLNPHDIDDRVDYLRMVELLGGGSPHCLVHWTVPYYKAAGSFLSETLPRLLRLGAPEDVRCVFFFDN
jgi:hypothetical protein